MLSEDGKTSEVAAKRKILSGEHITGRQEVEMQVAWPHHCLDCIHYPDIPEYKSLTPTEMAAGALGKILVEMPVELAGSETENMLKHFQKLFTYAFSMSWEAVLDFNSAFFRALENRRVSWTSWSKISAWHQMHIDAAKLKPGTGDDVRRSADRKPTRDDPKKDDKKSDKVPMRYLLDNHICIKFQDDMCPEDSAHQLAGGSTVQHICASCLHKGRGLHSDHGWNKCPKKLQSQPFHGGAVGLEASNRP